MRVETIITRADPRQTKRLVRNPAMRPRTSRSSPIAPPARPASARRTIASVIQLLEERKLCRDASREGMNWMHDLKRLRADQRCPPPPPPCAPADPPPCIPPPPKEWGMPPANPEDREKPPPLKVRPETLPWDV